MSPLQTTLHPPIFVGQTTTTCAAHGTARAAQGQEAQAKQQREEAQPRAVREEPADMMDLTGDVAGMQGE